MLTASNKVQQLVNRCLLKKPEMRPKISEFLEILSSASGKRAESPLAAVAARLTREMAVREAMEAQSRMHKEHRENAATEGLQLLMKYRKQLFDYISDQIGIAKKKPQEESVQLGSGMLFIRFVFPYIEKEKFKNSEWNILVGVQIKVTQNSRKYPERSANLWFGDIEGGENYRWREASYWILGHQSGRPEPFGIENMGEIRDADYAASSVMHTHNLASGVRPIDREGWDDFVERWSKHLAEAAVNEMRRPTRMPE